MWRERWIDQDERLRLVEAEQPDELELVIVEILSDAPRPGAPARFTPEQIVQIVAIACEDPKESGRPISHWTPREVRNEAIERGIVETISERQVGRFLKSGGGETASLQAMAECLPQRS